MQIDPFTLIAQILNFLILVALLRHFLYGPIVRMMEERSARIKEQMEDAEEKARQAERSAEAYRRDRQELEDKREALLREAREEADRHGAELRTRARENVTEAETRWRESLERGKQAFLQDLRGRTGEQVVQIARQTLADLADADLEDRMIGIFARRLREMDASEQAAMADQLRQSGVARIVTAFEPSEVARRELAGAVLGQFGDDTAIQFETSEDLVCGVELRTSGRKIGWSIASYLSELEEDIAAVLAAEYTAREDAGDGGEEA